MILYMDFKEIRSDPYKHAYWYHSFVLELVSVLIYRDLFSLTVNLPKPWEIAFYFA